MANKKIDDPSVTEITDANHTEKLPIQREGDDTPYKMGIGNSRLNLYQNPPVDSDWLDLAHINIGIVGEVDWTTVNLNTSSGVPVEAKAAILYIRFDLLTALSYNLHQLRLRPNADAGSTYYEFQMIGSELDPSGDPPAAVPIRQTIFMPLDDATFQYSIPPATGTFELYLEIHLVGWF